jgi:hypothetical protein
MTCQIPQIYNRLSDHATKQVKYHQLIMDNKKRTSFPHELFSIYTDLHKFTDGFLDNLLDIIYCYTQ